MKQFFPFRLDSVNQCVWRGETRISLRPKAYAVLSYLVQHGGRLVTQSELLQALWPNTFVQPEVLKSHILEVRAALGDDPKHPTFIETLPRRGYRFIQTAIQPEISHSAPILQVIGREREVETLHGYLERAHAGERQVVFVTGEAGIGKTTLTDAFIQHAREGVSGILIARGQSVEGHGVQEPYYPVLVALAKLLRQKADLVPLLETYAPTWLVQFPGILQPEQRQLLQREILGATRDRMIRELCEVLPLITAEETFLLILEDMHWADAATVELITAIAHRRNPARMMLMATYRPVEVVLSQHPLKLVKQDLTLHGLAHELAIEPLGEAAVASYLTAQSPGHNLPPDFAGTMHRITEGNPLFLRAALDHLIARGHLACAEDGWSMNVPLRALEMEVPESLRQMLELQVERLSQDERRALDVASVCGVSLLAHIGAAAGQFDPETYEGICQDLSRRCQILRVAGLEDLPNGTSTLRCKFNHAFYRQAIYDSLAPQRRSRLHLGVGQALESLYFRNAAEIAVELAVHFEAGGDWQTAARYLQLAAANKGQRFAYREVASDLEHALELLAKLPAGERGDAELEVMQKLGAIYFALEDFPRSISILEAVAKRAALAQDTLTEISALVQTGIVLGRTSAAQAMKLANRLLELYRREKDCVLRARACMSGLVLRLSGEASKEQDAQQFHAELEQARGHLDRQAQAAHSSEYALFLLFRSKYLDSVHILEETLPVMVEAGDIRHRYGLSALIMGLVFSGNWNKALHLAQDAVATARKNENHSREAALRVYQALAHVFLNDWTGALELCEAAFPALCGPAQILFLRQGLVLAGTALVGLGRYELASKHLSQARDGMDAQPVALDWYWRMPLQAALTELSLERGDLQQARIEVHRFVEASLATTERTWQALAWEAGARVALAGSNLQYGQECIRKALAAMQGLDLPLAFWRVHATAMQLFPEVQEEHQRLSVDVILRLAASLKEFPSLQEGFLSSEPVRSLLSSRKAACDLELPQPRPLTQRARRLNSTLYN